MLLVNVSCATNGPRSSTRAGLKNSPPASSWTSLATESCQTQGTPPPRHIPNASEEGSGAKDAAPAPWGWLLSSGRSLNLGNPSEMYGNERGAKSAGVGGSQVRQWTRCCLQRPKRKTLTEDTWWTVASAPSGGPAPWMCGLARPPVDLSHFWLVLGLKGPPQVGAFLIVKRCVWRLMLKTRYGCVLKRV